MASLRSRSLPFLLALAAVGCGSSKSSSPPPLGDTVTNANPLRIIASAASASADGKTSVVLTITGSTSAPITVKTTLGTLSSGGAGTSLNTSVTLPADGAVSIMSCDATKSSGCTGAAVITATDGGNHTATTTVVFTATESCTNAADDDGNGLIDCADKTACPAGTKCGATSTCGATGTCDACKAASPFKTEVTEMSCGDGGDNDCDGLIDCADPDCNAMACSIPTVLAGQCANAACSCKSTKEDCTNGMDDDCNGKSDCDDPACLGLQCGSSVTQICQKTSCTDTVTAYVLTLTPDRAAIPADGKSTATIAVKLVNAAGGATVKQTITLTLAGQGAWVDGMGAPTGSPTVTLVTDQNGTASATLASDANGGTATITAAFTPDPMMQPITQTTSIRQPAVGSVVLATQQYSVLGVASSGFQEESQLVFQLLDDGNMPYPAGLAVTVSHKPLGGSTIGPPQVPTCTQTGCSVSIPATTDANGKITTTLYAGTLAGTVNVTLDTVAADKPTHFDSTPIPIVGAKANGSHFSVVCSPGNVAAFSASDCIFSNLAQTIACTASLADRFGNVLGVATSVSMKSEAGNVGEPTSTPAYGASGKLGQTVLTISTMGGPLPIDVDPHADESSAVVPTALDRCADTTKAPRTHNPRDGAVAVIAITKGEEGYVDVNGNGNHDDGEPFVDLAEPFVDANDSGDRDGNEAYVDANGNGVWDPPNHLWDSNTTIWAESRVTYSDSPIGRGVAAGDQYSRWFPLGSENGLATPAPTQPPVIEIDGTTIDIGVGFTDINFNPLAFDATFPTLVTNNVQATQDAAYGANFPEGYFFHQRYCDGASGGDPTNCDLVCPPGGPTSTVTECAPKGTVDQYNAFTRTRVTLKATLPNSPWDVTATASAGAVSLALKLNGHTTK